jgi:hypothetical protein
MIPDPASAPVTPIAKPACPCATLAAINKAASAGIQLLLYPGKTCSAAANPPEFLPQLSRSAT